MKTFSAAYVNLLKTSIGSGVLSFPYLFKTYGIVTTIIFTFISGFFATCGLVLLTVCSQGLGRSADMSKLATQAFPLARFVVDFAVFSKCFGVSLSYVIITKNLIPTVLNAIGIDSPFFLYSPINVLIFLGFIGPFAYFSKLDKLKYTSFIGVVLILIVIVLSIITYFSNTNPLPAVTLVEPVSLLWFDSFGKFVFSFTCHQNIFSVNAELTDNSIPRMRKLIYSVAGTAFFLYISFGLANYLIFGRAASNNILDNYSNNLIGILVRLLYIFVMAMSFPLQITPARIYLMNMLHISTESKHYKICHFVITTVLIIFTYLIAISGVDIGLVYSIVGATASCFMCLILPALFYINLEIKKTMFLSIVSLISFLLGIFVFSTTIISLVIHKTPHI